jgi:two-component system, NarL family, sensor kinase
MFTKRMLAFLIIGNISLLFSTKALANKENDTLAIKALFVQAMEYQDYDNDSSWILAEQGFSLSKKANYKAGIGMAFMRFGALMNIKGKSDSALYYFKQAFSIRKELNNVVGMASICQQISYVYRNIGKKDSAFFYMYEAQRLFDETKDSVSIASIYIELANLNTTYKNYIQSEKYLAKALPIFAKVKQPTTTLSNICRIRCIVF